MKKVNHYFSSYSANKTAIIKDAFDFDVKLSGHVTNKKINLYKDAQYFTNYETLYSKLDDVNEQAKKFSVRFLTIRLQNSAWISGHSLWSQHEDTINPTDKFRVYLRIFDKMFKKELTKDRVRKIIAKIENNIVEKINKEKSL